MDTLAFLEASAEEWWDRLNKEEQEVYLKAHPNTRMNESFNPFQKIIHNATAEQVRGIAKRSGSRLARFIVDNNERLHAGNAEFFNHTDVSPDPDKAYSHITGFVKYTPEDQTNPFKFQYNSNHADENHPSLRGLGKYHPDGDFWDDINGIIA